MGGFLGIGNSSAKTDRGRALGGWNAEWENLAQNRGVTNSLFPQAQQGTAQATSNIGQGADFWKDILGSRTQAAAAMAPETNQIASQADTLRQAQANLGTSRGGGTAASNQQLNQGVQNQVANATFAARPQAAGQVVTAGQAQAQVAAQQLQAALQAMGMSNEVAAHIVESSMRSRLQSAALNKDVVGQWTSLAGNLLGVVPGLGAAGKTAGSILSGM